MSRFVSSTNLPEGLVRAMDGPKDLKLLTQLICEKVEEALQGDLGEIKLAALLWSACAKLWNKEEVAQVPEEWGPAKQGLGEAALVLRSLGTAPAAPASTDLYKALVDILSAVEDAIDPATTPPVTIVILEELQPSPPLLPGTVEVWFRERRSPFRQARENRRGYVPRSGGEDIKTGAYIPKAMRYRPEPDRHLRSLTFLFVALDRPNAKLLPPQGEREALLWGPFLRSFDIHDEDSLRIALCPLKGPWLPHFDIQETGEEMRFLARPRVFEEAPGALTEHLDKVLQEAESQSVRILVFPELSIDVELRRSLRRKLRELRSKTIWAVIGGTFHIESASGAYRNEAVVWDSRGEPLWKQNKQGLFRLEPEAVWKGRSFFPALKERPTTSIVEGIQRGGELVVVDAPLGRLAILICADALEPAGYKEVLRRVQPDFVFILAMSPKTAEFDRERKWFVNQGVGVLFVNAACICQKQLDDELVFVDLSLQEGQNSLPTRWRWPIGGLPEWHKYHVKESWHSLGELEEELAARGRESPVRVMASNAGMILDVAPYLHEGLSVVGEHAKQ